jgi:hypothetical protein
MRNTLELVDVDSDRLEDVLRRAEQSLDEKDAELIRAVFELYAYVTELVEDKNTTIRRLRQLFFGSQTGANRRSVPDGRRASTAVVVGSGVVIRTGTTVGAAAGVAARVSRRFHW